MSSNEADASVHVPTVVNDALPTPSMLMNALAQVLDNPVAIEVIRDRYNKLKEFWDEFMIPVDEKTQVGDYGIQPGTKSIAIRLSCGQKLKGFFKVYDRPRITHRVDDWDRGLFAFDYDVDIISHFTGQVVAIGIGSCNSYEQKYRWRTSQRVCPDCGAAAIQRSKYGLKGWWCSDRVGGCKAEFEKDDPAITDQQVGRVQNPDIYDVVNTCHRMAKKRAFLDGMAALIRACGFDVEIDPAEDGGDDDGKGHGGGNGHDTKGGDKGKGTVADTVSEGDRKRFADAFLSAGHKWADVVAWAKEKYEGLDLSKQGVPRAKFDEMLARVSQKEPLLTPGQQELVK